MVVYKSKLPEKRKFGVEILLLYLLRHSPLSRALGIVIRQARRYLQRMRPPLGTSCWASRGCARGSRCRPGPKAGKHGGLATAALYLIVLQAMSGLTLQAAGLRARAKIRSWHYWTMMAVVLCVVT